MVALLNLNDNNGYTEFETGEKIVSKENELIIFDGNTRHRSVTQTDTNIRLTMPVTNNISPTFSRVNTCLDEDFSS